MIKLMTSAEWALDKFVKAKTFKMPQCFRQWFRDRPKTYLAVWVIKNIVEIWLAPLFFRIVGPFVSSHIVELFVVAVVAGLARIIKR